MRQTGLELQVQQIAVLDFGLQIGPISEVIEVSAAAVLLDSKSDTVGRVIGWRQVRELPLLGRNPYALAMLVPGVRPMSGVNNLPIDQLSTTSFVINGQRATANDFLLDGAPNSAAAQNQPVINTNPDVVQEFKVETNNYSAEYGRTGGGVFNVVTRSGSNQLHFSAYEFFRNELLNANDFFANASGQPRPPFKFNQFGGTFGAPVVVPGVYDGRNRTFLFAGVELVRFLQGITFTGTVPQPDQLAGDFSNARNAAGAVVAIYDPASTRPNPAGGFLRTPFAGNLIPPNRIDPIARNVSRFFPAPNAAGNRTTGVNNYARTAGNTIDKDTSSIRLDHNFTTGHRLFVRYSFDETPFRRAAPFGDDNVASPIPGLQTFDRQNAVLEDSLTLSPSTIATLRYSITRLGNRREPFSDGFDIASLGLPASLQSQIGEPRTFPAINITGYSVSGSIPNNVLNNTLGSGEFIRLGNTSHALQGSLARSVRRHTWKAGAEARLIQYFNQQTLSTAVSFTFNPQWTQGPNPSTSSAAAGLGLASFLLGVPAGSVTPAPAVTQSTRYYAVYLQDTYTVTDRLTLNSGIRWEYESPRRDRYDVLTNFDFNVRSPLQVPGYDLRGGLTFVGVNGISRYNANPDRNNISPRLGIAYRLFPKTIVRSGAGIFFASSTGIGANSAAFGISGFQTSTSLVTSLDGVTPIVSWSNPYPQGLNRPTGSTQGLATLLGQDIAFFNRGNRLPYSAHWNFNIQQELPFASVFEIGYAGSRGIKFPQNRSYNQIPDSALALGDGLRQQVTNPFRGQIAVGTLANPTVARVQLLRPFPHFGNVVSMNEDWASSTWHALESSLEKRFSRGFLLLASYTWSKLMDIGTGSFGGEELSGVVRQSNNDIVSDWGTSVADMTHRFIVSSVYEFPLARGRRGVARAIFGGWQIAGIWSAFSGSPLGIDSAVNSNFAQGAGQRPDWNGVSPSIPDPRPERWFDTAVFSSPAPYRFGTAPRTFNGTRSDGTSSVDLTLAKNSRIREQYVLQFRAECFNISNSPRFAPPNIVFGNSQFGVVSAQGNLPRIVQFGLKLSR